MQKFGRCPILVFLLLSISCGQDKQKLEQIKIPIWDRNDIERTERLIDMRSDSSTILVDSISIDSDTPYLKGEVPPKVIFKRICKSSILVLEIVDDFGDFRNEFIYSDDFGYFPVGARTFDKKGNLLAEAKLTAILGIAGGGGATLNEYHYNQNEELVFMCGSKVTFYSKKLSDAEFYVKLFEKEPIGKKVRSYYFLWPTGHDW